MKIHYDRMKPLELHVQVKMSFLKLLVVKGMQHCTCKRAIIGAVSCPVDLDCGSNDLGLQSPYMRVYLLMDLLAYSSHGRRILGPV